MLTAGGLPMLSHCQLAPSDQRHHRLKSFPSKKTCGRCGAPGASLTATAPSGVRRFAVGGLPMFSQCQFAPSDQRHHRLLSLPTMKTCARCGDAAVSMTVTAPAKATRFAVAGLPMLSQCQLAPSLQRHHRLKSLPSKNTCGRCADVGVFITVTAPSGARRFAVGGFDMLSHCQ